MKRNPLPSALLWLLGCALLGIYGVVGCSRNGGEITYRVVRGPETSTDPIEVTTNRPVLPPPGVDFPFSDWTSPEVASDALARIGPVALPQLIDALEDQDPVVRTNAARALALMGADAEPAVPALIEALDDPSADVRRNAARALGQVGGKAADAVPRLIKMLGERPESAVPAATSP